MRTTIGVVFGGRSSEHGVSCLTAREVLGHIGDVRDLTTPVDTHKLWQLQVREYKNMARDWRSAAGWRGRAGYVFGPPGWRP